jgi:hypothetical protein
MTDMLFSAPTASQAGRDGAAWFAAPAAARLVLILAIAIAALAGFLATGADDAARASADAELTRLLRAMAGLKLLFAVAAAGAVYWRLGAPVTPLWLAAYTAACAAMFAGPGLIWNMAHVGLGAILLHAGLAATVLLVWRDRVTAARLDAMIARRRAALRGR